MATKKDENKEEPVSIDAQVKEIKEGLNALWAIVRPLKDFLKSMYPDVIDKGGKTAALLLMLGLTAVCAFAVSPLADTNAVLQYEDPDAPTNKLFTLDRQGNLNIDGSLAASGGAGLYRDVYVSGVATAENLRVWGASAVNSLTATGAVVLSGTVNLKDGSVTNEDLAADAVTGTKVADGTISNPCLTTKSIDATKLTGTAGRMIIADAGATGQWKAISGPVLIGQDGKSDVINSAITNENLAADAVTSAKIAQNTIVGSDLATNAVGEEQIATAVRSTNLFANLLWDVSLSSAESASPSNATITIQCRNPWGTSIAAAKSVQLWFTTPTVQTVPSIIGMNSWSFDAHGTVKSYWDLGTVQSNYIYTVESHTDGTIDIIAQADAANWTNYVYVLANGSVTSCAVVYKE